MASQERMEQKLMQLKERLQEWGHVPSQKEDRALYANVKYYYSRYPEHPTVRQLMTDYPFPVSNRKPYIKHENLYPRIQSLEEKLKALGRVPTSNEDNALLHEVGYCYRTFSNHPLVMRLRALYPTNSIYSKWGKTQHEGLPDSIPIPTTGIVFNHGQLIIGGHRYVEDPFLRAKKYILDCIEKYGEVPGLKTWPMHFAFEQMKGKYRNALPNGMLALAEQLIERGLVSDEEFIRKYYSACLDQPFLHERIDLILEENLIVTLRYLARHLVPGVTIDERCLYNYFYYQEQNKGYPHEGVRKEHRHCYRIMQANRNVICSNFDKLLNLDFKSLAKEIPFDVLPDENAGYLGDETELAYAKAYLFHQTTQVIAEGGGKFKLIRRMDRNQTLLDDIASGICPFLYFDKSPLYDAPALTIDWCCLLIRLHSPLLLSYIKNGFFKELSMMLAKLPASHTAKAETLRAYLREQYGYELPTN